jgi:hypothetical protein
MGGGAVRATGGTLARVSGLLDGCRSRRWRRRAPQPREKENGNYSLAARDTVFSLCDGTDRGFGSFDDGEVVERRVMQSDNLRIQCFNNGASVVLHVRYELVGKNVMLECATLPDGSPVSTIVLHRVSED